MASYPAIPPSWRRDPDSLGWVIPTPRGPVTVSDEMARRGTVDREWFVRELRARIELAYPDVSASPFVQAIDAYSAGAL